MVFQIQRGLFLADFADHYATLGLPITADPKEIRKNYLKIARRLHPDSAASASDTDKQLAEQLLSKLVNPAWEQLSQDKNRTEYVLLLKLKGKAAARQTIDPTSLSAMAQELMTASNLDHAYRTAVQELSSRQYEQMDQAIDLTGQISEVNLVYLMRSEGEGLKIGRPQSAAESSARTSSSSTNAATSAPPASGDRTKTPFAHIPRQSLAEPYYNRAEVAFRRQNYAQAVLELRDALKIEPKNSRFHSLMGMVYLEQKQATMARISFDKALEFNPEDEMALLGKQRLQQMTAKTTPTNGAAGKSAADKPTPGKSGGKANDKSDGKSGGLFGGLFGKKK
ncbi:DnaJ domain-containing protein [Alkalinema pantanalense CENA528]|uniref:J domain-containing protein n=1 Tax=Alkalinema pantanalense TaxID=1620705 RepID=UPI003D6F4A18